MRPTLPLRPAPSLILALAASLAACEPATAPVESVDPLLVTDRAEYTLVRVDDGVYRALIPYSFSNFTGAPVALDNCAGTFPLGLERWDGDAWTRAWSPPVILCVSPRIVIGTGDVFEDTLEVYAALPARAPAGALPLDGVQGRYRIVWDFPIGEYVEGFPESGIRLSKEKRVSNPFDLVRP